MADSGRSELTWVVSSGVEQWTFNPLVEGSNPSQPTTFSSMILIGSLAQLVEQRTLNPLVAGSIPSRPTMPSHRPNVGR